MNASSSRWELPLPLDSSVVDLTTTAMRVVDRTAMNRYDAVERREVESGGGKKRDGG